MADGKSSAPNIQDVFLNYARREKLAVTVHLLDGRQFECRIKNFDDRHTSRAAQRAELLLVAPPVIG
jgi:RNA chaperone Hfq